MISSSLNGIVIFVKHVEPCDIQLSSAQQVFSELKLRIMCILRIICIQIHESVLAAMTVLPDLIKWWPEWIVSWRGHSCRAPSKAFWYVDIFLIQQNDRKILSVLALTCQAFMYFCFHFDLFLYIYLLALVFLQCRNKINRSTEYTYRWVMDGRRVFCFFYSTCCLPLVYLLSEGKKEVWSHVVSPHTLTGSRGLSN